MITDAMNRKERLSGLFVTNWDFTHILVKLLGIFTALSLIAGYRELSGFSLVSAKQLLNFIWF
jgi:hypothetical protein